MKDRGDFLEQISRLRINTDKSVQRRAPHKPLLILLYLSLLQQGRERLQPYVEIEPTLFEALRRFGPLRKQIHPEYPFWALTNDGIFEVKHRGVLVKKKNDHKPTRASLVEAEASGGFVTSVYFLLREDRAVQSAVIHKLLDEHFPVSLHEDLLHFFNLRLPPPSPSSIDNAVSGRFRDEVLNAYGHRCCLSGYSIGVPGTPGLEVALLCWRQVGGKLSLANAITTTTTLRKLFDLGLLSLDEDYTIVVASSVLGNPQTTSELSSLHGRKVALPQNTALHPSVANIRWHQREVFRG